MIIPKTADRPVIAFMATARFAEGEFIDAAVKILENQNCAVLLPPKLFAVENQFGGSDAERFDTFKSLWEHPEIDAIWIVRGGYGSVRICPKIEELIRTSPQKKWVIGYSDVTAIHAVMANEGICSIHGTMPVNFATNSENAITNIVNCLKTSRIQGLQQKPHEFNVHGSVSGKLIGGNLSMLYSLQATQFQPNYADSILFIEDLDEYLYHIDRIFQNLLHSNVLHQIKGLVVGQLSNMHDNKVPFGATAEEIVKKYAWQLEIPVAFNMPFGHIDDNLPLLHGAHVNLVVNHQGGNLSYI